MEKTEGAYSLRVELVTTLEKLRALRPDYDRLNRIAGNILPFALHDWHLFWCKHFLSDKGPVRDELRVCVVRNSDGFCVAIVPLFLTRRVFGGVEIRVLGLLGRDPGVTEILGPLIHPGYEADVAAVVQARLAAMGKWDWIEWTACSGRFRDALASACRLERQTPMINYVIELPVSWESLYARLKRNIRRSLRHCYNSLKRDGLHYEFAVIAERESMDEALDRFLHLHSLRAQLTGTVPHPNVFASQSARLFLRDVCASLADQKIVRIFELKIGNQVVASRIGFVVGDALYLYYSGYDPAWGRYSVMTTTVAEAIKYAITLGLRSVRLSPGTDVSKTRWGPRPMMFWPAAQIGMRWRSRVARACYKQIRHASRPRGLLSPLLTPLKRRWG